MNRDVVLFEPVSHENFREDAYLAANPDVAAAVAGKAFRSGIDHFRQHGFREYRKQKIFDADARIASVRSRKLARLRPYLRAPFTIRPDGVVDTLTDEVREAFGVNRCENVSANAYDRDATASIEKLRDGLILDCGAGFREVYHENVVNFEIKEYVTTDVLGVAERLPFEDACFDAVFSFAVLEHVKFPWLAARELCRVLKRDGVIIVNVPFLQPLHGYPHHYFNMTHMGVRSLFQTEIAIESITVPASMGPIWTLTWFLRSWAEGLSGEAREKFLRMSVASLIDHPSKYLSEPFVGQLDEGRNFELASGTLLIGSKR
ncbi:MAG: class I SAM-dependent methyltransferase [Xanthobacteraceae bacterium]